MMNYDVAVIGSGMAGSVTALLLAKLGYRTLMIESGSHPRFALGESSTPVMSKKIRNLGMVYDIPEFIELSTYDSIMAATRPLLCGPKELFHYFHHEQGQTTAAVNGRYREIVVQTPEVDTQFLRCELDMRLVEYAKKYGAEYMDHTTVSELQFGEDGAVMSVQKEGESSSRIKAQFVVDATGFRSLLSKTLNLRVPDDELDTPLRSRCIFTHFESVGRLEDAIDPDPIFNERLSVDRIRATQHHVFDGGWYWFIPFDNGVTSVGLNLDMDKYPATGLSPEEEFWQFTQRYPIVQKMLENRRTVMPYIGTGRLQFRTKQAAGDRWALLPAAAVGADAWFSTGLGLGLVAIHRLVNALHTRILPDGDFRKKHLEHYESALFKEWWYITRMMDGIYKSFKHFEVFQNYCFFCFLGAESFVRTGGILRPDDPECLMLNVGDRRFVEKFTQVYEHVLRCNTKEHVTPEDTAYITRHLQHEMKEYNYRDYGNPSHEGIHYRASANVHSVSQSMATNAA